MQKLSSLKNLQLTISAIVVIAAGFVYGGNPSEFLPHIFGFEVADLELKNIFRAIMGLYFAFGVYWIVGIRNPIHWRGATISNIIFMGGIASGRLLSTTIDGISIQYAIGMLLEIIFFCWGWYNLRKYEELIPTDGP